MEKVRNIITFYYDKDTYVCQYTATCFYDNCFEWLTLHYGYCSMVRHIGVISSIYQMHNIPKRLLYTRRSIYIYPESTKPCMVLVTISLTLLTALKLDFSV